MFKNLMNNYYFGKAGKADLTPDDLPTNRWQLFLDTLRTRFSALIRLNLMYVVAWIPTIIVIAICFTGFLNVSNQLDLGDGTSIQSQAYDQVAADIAAGIEVSETDKELYSSRLPVLTSQEASDQLLGLVNITLLLLIPCIAITGPVTSGVCYVTQHWSRDEHAFIWSDFKDAMKENWKQSLVVSLITGVLPLAVYTGYRFYGSMALTQPLMIVPQVLLIMVGIVWAISVTYMYPLIVSYRLRMRDVIHNALMLAIARLPMSVGIRVLHLLPCAIGVAGALFLNAQWFMLGLLLYYVLFGYSFSRFITSSYTNAVFDRFINPRIEGAPVNRGLHIEEEDDGEDEE